MKHTKIRKKTMAVLLTVALTVTVFPQITKKVHAAGLPDSTKFATVGELEQFNTNDNDGEINPAKVYFGKDSQQWWIVGSQDEKELTLFATSPLMEKQPFEPNDSDLKKYSSIWNCTYVNGRNLTAVYPNHYGASPLRNTLKDLETSYFTDAEQALMKETTVYTNDTLNNSVYSTTDKLYLPYGVNKDIYVTVGENTSDNLNNGLWIDNKYWGSDEFWLRAEPVNGLSSDALWASGIIGAFDIGSLGDLVPAFELNLSSVIFASAASAAASDGVLTTNDAFTLRYQTNDLGSAQVSYDRSKVTLNGVPKNTYLVVQNSAGAKAKKISNETFISASDMDLDSFANCKVWLEKTDTEQRITSATLAKEEQGYSVNIAENTGLKITSNNGNQKVALNTAITNITVDVTNGYYLPWGYIDSIQGLNGLSVTKTDTGFTISGTPSNDVKITLPAATVLPKSDTPQVTISKTATSITASVTNHQKEFGNIEYKWNDGSFETDKNMLSHLQADTTYKLAVRFTGNGFYQMSDEYSVDITTLKDGDSVIEVPTQLVIIYKEGLKLSDVALLSDSGWSWKNGETSLSVGTKSYPATFDTTNLESTTDFSKVDGYDAATHKVTRNVEVKVEKAVSKVYIKTPSLDKEYDGNAVTAPEYVTSGSNGKATIKWQENTGTKDTPKWEDLKSAPSEVGTYRVVVELEENDNYNSANAALEFVISKIANAWTEELVITGWTYNEKANVPTAEAKLGEVTFTYSSEENGTYTSNVPTNAGTWYVKAAVAGTEHYTGLESAPVVFEITKAIPTYEKVTGLLLGQGQPFSKIKLPEQFKWVDETTTADELGTHTFKAIYTPVDTANYETIEVEIEVEVVPTPVVVNHVPKISTSDKTITVGGKFDALKDVTASDQEDGNLTSKIKVIKNTVDTKKAGIYEVIYQVTDSQGASVTKTIKVTVEAKLTPVNPDNNKPDNDKNNGSIETGDSTNLLIWEVLVIGSGIIVLYSLYRKKRKTNP